MVCRVIDALMADDAPAATLALAPWGPGTLHTVSWSVDPKDRCYVFETPTDWNIFFRGIISATDFANAFLGSLRVTAPGGVGSTLAYFADDYTAMATVVVPWLIARFDALTVVNPKLGIFGHSRGGSLARLLCSADPIRSRIDRGASIIIELGSPRVTDTSYNMNLGIQGRHFSMPADTITQIVPRTWGNGWPSPLPLVPWITSMGTPYRRFLLSNVGYLEREPSEEGPVDEPAPLTLWGLASLVLEPTPHYIGTYRDFFASQSVMYGPATIPIGGFIMPAPTNLAVDDVLEFTVDGRADSQQVTNVLHFRVNSALVPPTTNVTLIAALVALWRINILPLLNENFAVANYLMKKIASVTAGVPTPNQPHPFTLAFEWEIAQPGAAADVGGTAGASLPTFVTASVRKLTGFGGRYWRGGIRFGTINEADTLAGGNQLTGAAKTAWEAASQQVLRNNPPGGLPDYVTSVVFSGTYAAWGPAAPYTVIESTADVLDRSVNQRVGSLVSRRFRATGG